MEPLYKEFDLYTCDIWNYEKEVLSEGKYPHEYGQKLLSQMKQIITQKAKPVFTINHSDQENAQYYESRLLRYTNSFSSISSQYSLTYFFNYDDCYSYDNVIKVVKTETEDFEFWFALKLRQYHEKLLLINEFLNHHLTKSFENNQSSYLTFLTLTVRQYKNIFTEEVILTVEEWIDKSSPLIENMEKSASTKEKEFLAEPKEILINILPDIRTATIEALTPYFENDSIDKLEQLINGQSIEGKIQFKGQSNQFIFLIRQLMLNQKLTQSCIHIEKWICKYFDYDGRKKGIIPFSPKNVHNVLTKSVYKIPKQKRIEVIGLQFIEEKTK